MEGQRNEHPVQDAFREARAKFGENYRTVVTVGMLLLTITGGLVQGCLGGDPVKNATATAEAQAETSDALMMTAVEATSPYLIQTRTAGYATKTAEASNN